MFAAPLLFAAALSPFAEQVREAIQNRETARAEYHHCLEGVIPELVQLHENEDAETIVCVAEYKCRTEWAGLDIALHLYAYWESVAGNQISGDDFSRRWRDDLHNEFLSMVFEIRAPSGDQPPKM